VLLIKNGSCLFRTGEQEKTAASFVVELETTASRENLLQVLNGNSELQFNGGFYTITSKDLSAQELLSKLVAGNIAITYFRDITHSTKRYI
jgi:ABC-2 type transport system ATP-binding protein